MACISLTAHTVRRVDKTMWACWTGGVGTMRETEVPGRL